MLSSERNTRLFWPTDPATGDADDATDVRILVADDNKSARAMVEMCLRNAGYTQLNFAVDGMEGLKLAFSWNPDIIITDVMMPNVDGHEFCRWIRAEPRFADIPIIAMTALDDSDGRADIFNSGANDLVVKPLNPLELTSRVRLHVEQRRLTRRLIQYQNRIARELGVARAMQESLLPTREELARLSERLPIDIAASYESSSEMGGDLWGCEPLPRNRMRIYAADFTGHGVGSALNTFRLHTFLKTGAARAEHPSAWLGLVNDFLCEVLSVGQFATMFYAVIDFNAETMTCASAASPPPLLCDGRGFKPLNLAGLPLGVLSSAEYEAETVAFPRGSRLLVYSDALIETPDPAEPVLNGEQLATYLDSLDRKMGAEPFRASVRTRLDELEPGPLPDDLTLITLRHEELDT